MNTVSLFAILTAYSAGMAFGQVLFKLAAKTIEEAHPPGALLAYFNAYFIAGAILYTALIVLWVWLLRFVPLSKAYPFVALAFVFTPLLANVLLKEELSVSYFVGMFLITAGIIVISAQSNT